MSGLARAVGSVFSTVTSAVTSLFGGAPDPAPAPAPAPVIVQAPQLPQLPPAPVAPPVAAAVEPPPPMPIPDDKAVLMQQRKSIAQLVKTRGRASTILTSDGSLGTPPEALGG